MKTNESKTGNLGGYSNVVIVLNNDEKCRNLAKRVAELNSNGKYVMPYENFASVFPIGDGLYVRNSAYGIDAFCKDPELKELVSKKKDVIGAFSKVIDQNDCIITLELTVFHDLTMDDILKQAANANF